MDRLFNNKWFLRFVSLVIAFMLFLMVNMDELSNQPGMLPISNTDRLTVEDVELEVYYDDENYAVVDMIDTVDVRLSGPSSSLRLFQMTNPQYEVYVDLEDLGVGIHNVNIEHRNFPAGVNVSVLPESTRVHLEERQTVSMPIEVELMNQNEVMAGHTVGEPEVTPGEVQVTGAASQLEEIDSLQTFVDVSGAGETIEESADVLVYGPHGEELDFNVYPETVDIVVPITLPSTEVPLDFSTEGTLPDEVDNIDLSLDPEVVTIYGKLDVLEQISSLDAGSVNLNDITENEVREVDLERPDGVEYVRPQTSTINIEVQQGNEETRTMEIPLEFDNLPAEYEVSIPVLAGGDSEVAVEIMGEEDELDELTEDDVRVYMDFGNIDEQSGSLPIQIAGLEGFVYEIEYEELEFALTN